MEKRIIIEQEAYLSVDDGDKLDMVDIAILEFIYKKWSKAVKRDKLVYLYYVEVPTELIMEAFPCFNIKTKGGLKRHIRKLKKLGFLETHPDCSALAKSLYVITDKTTTVGLVKNAQKDFVYNMMVKR